MRIGSLFSGIGGGLELACERVFGGAPAWQIEGIDLTSSWEAGPHPMRQKKMAWHWPDARQLCDVTGDHAWPAGRGAEQLPHEPSRLVAPRTVPGRAECEFTQLPMADGKSPTPAEEIRCYKNMITMLKNYGETNPR